MKKLLKNFIISYDDLADTLYISLKRQDKATNTFLDDDFVIVRKKENEICGITIDGYKDRHEDKSWNDNLILKYLPSFEINSLRGII
jgi:uncharacterized protein YuzE